MFFSTKKKVPNATAPNSSPNGNLKSVTESLYKQNLELSVKNKILSLLRQLYQISISAFDPESLGKEVAKAVNNALELELTGIFILAENSKKLSPLAFFSSERLHNAESKSGYFLSSFDISYPEKSVFLEPIVKDKIPSHADDFGDIWKGALPDVAKKVFIEETHVKTTSGYPLIAENKLLGVIIFCMNREFETLPQYEKDSIKIFVDVIAVALNTSLLYKELKMANERQESLIHFIGHEIKGYLTKSQAVFSTIVDDDYGVAPPELKRIVNIALEDNKEGVDTVMNMLNAVNVKKGSMRFEMQPFDVKTAVLQTMDELKQNADLKGLSLETKIAEGDYTMVGDGEQLAKHVIRNLVDNSIRYTQTGGVKVSLEKRGEKILFGVKDTGIGITDEDKARLFTEGGRGANSTKVNVHSTGYGLFFAKGIVEAHKGRIWAESEGGGKGSTFFVELPVNRG